MPPRLLTPFSGKETVQKIDSDWRSARAESLCKCVRAVSLESTLAETTEAMRVLSLSQICVLDHGRLAFAVSASDVSRFLSVSSDFEAASRRTISSAVQQDLSRDPSDRFFPPTAPFHAPLSEVAKLFEEYPNAAFVAILGREGLYKGTISRLDFTAFRTKSLAPPRMGGMATPLGVYLTDGINSGGAGALGLFLSGMSMGGLYLLSLMVMELLFVFLAAHAKFNLYGLLSSRLGEEGASDAFGLISMPILLVMMRLTPLAGYHAAEHQVVNCVERGNSLTISNVRRASRVHPRCGTNLAVGFSIFSILLLCLSVEWKTIVGAVAPALLLSAALWRPLGSAAQQWLTTRPATDKQIASGIRAAEQLKAKYWRNVEVRPTPRSRLFASGLPLMLLGMMLVMGVAQLLVKIFPTIAQYLPAFS